MSFPTPEGEVLPPHTDGIPAQPIPDYEREASRPNSRERGWNILATPGTYILLGINITVFCYMIFRGVSPSSPTPYQLLYFGATSPELILHGQWYRLLTATFVHVGLLHIATNMWCLWNLGLLGEPLLGPFGLIAVYVITGVAGNLLGLFTSVFFHEYGSSGAAGGLLNLLYKLLYSGYDSVGAGASGAVFGIAGILIVLLSNKKLPIPAFELNRLRRSVIQFAILNLIIGLGANFTSIVRIDNHAHIGGFLTGLALGVPLVPRMTSGRTRYLARQKLTFAAATFALILFAYFIAKLR
ncbi:rhomboid family intramembrane serine protease [Tunturibacter empetritectus]|uniref:Rhomboid protease GluP n=1 Tax=Tunturiibacter lichenicola TaxID=2051959 RepID=A0A7W8JCS6_9BACT|nr:rhomboid family intramembrane serine protease [Edaphobacter lichenicola]MBB5345567.1 rhomboid protease GluP [Edaphobacter lichenicola]